MHVHTAEAWLYTCECWQIPVRLAASCGSGSGIPAPVAPMPTSPLRLGSCIAAADPWAAGVGLLAAGVGAMDRWSPDSGGRNRSRKSRITPIPPPYPKWSGRCRLPAAGFCRRGAQAETGARQSRGRRGFPASRRRLRREFRRALRRQHSRFFSRLPADGGRDDVRRRLAGGEGRVHRRAVRQAPVGSAGRDRRRRAPELSRRIVNDIEFTPGARAPDPQRQLNAYRQSAATLNLIRAFATGGYANLENAHRWMLGFIEDSPRSSRCANSPTASPRRSASWRDRARSRGA